MHAHSSACSHGEPSAEDMALLQALTADPKADRRGGVKMDPFILTMAAASGPG
jgi:hypothetical protein